MTQRDVNLSPEHISLPDERSSITHKFIIDEFKGYITVGLYGDGHPGELFIRAEKEGTALGGVLNAFAIAISMGLQRGISLDDYIKKFKHMRFEPEGLTQNPDIRFASSVMDYIFRWLEIKFPNAIESSPEAAVTEQPLILTREPEESCSEERPDNDSSRSNRSCSSSRRSSPACEGNTAGYSISCSSADGGRKTF